MPAKAKQHRTVYIKSLTRSTTPFSIVHSYVWGPAPIVSRSGFLDFISFIDYFSRFTLLYLLKSISGVPKVFQIFHKMVKTQFNVSVKCLRTDNASEYVSSEMVSYLQGCGIELQNSCAYSPQQNGLSERKNRHLLEVTRSLLCGMSVPNTFWSFAVLTACYLINRMPTRVLNGKSPFSI